MGFFSALRKALGAEIGGGFIVRPNLEKDTVSLEEVSEEKAKEYKENGFKDPHGIVFYFYKDSGWSYQSVLQRAKAHQFHLQTNMTYDTWKDAKFKADMIAAENRKAMAKEQLADAMKNRGNGSN